MADCPNHIGGCGSSDGGGSVSFMAKKPISEKDLDRATELVNIMRAAEDGGDLTDFNRALAELRSLLPPAGDA